ncbi:molybdate ABC transporter substrate-binding protein [Franzmannia qiaohouensis]|uniref:Molybdate ABC transporter substrate-binding protein n=1 Tax=Franzmannia qiaohouensis TaxID=1329370 RepID=A0ABU1HD51_9GAMM|nr:molybdate ABC transporter substrate-binding protein [Halomonas qiaohouensis]MDR5904928.1 molybdate ABC transporter substrate-binding protein [Halomonas qiaohouensis]
MKYVALGLLGASVLMTTSAQAYEPVKLHAAGSLRAALTEVADAFTDQYGVVMESTFGPSGLLREGIESGQRPHIFASANMTHPQTLEEQGIGGPVTLFARNRLCGLAYSDMDITTDTFLDVLLDDNVIVGTSTPNADPSGDYAWELFELAENMRQGSFERLNDKAKQLTGGPDSETAPDGRNQYAWVMTEDRADIFLTYCTNAVLAQQDTSDLKIIQVPESLSVGADYGLTVLAPDNQEAVRFALFVLSDTGQAILGAYGFDTPTRVSTNQ